jgi:hypothetical protein
MVSKYIEHIEKEITDGKLEASHFIPVLELKESEALIFYRAWRVHLVDRMMEEHDKNRSEKYHSDPTKELKDDTMYFKKVQDKERQQKLNMMTIKSNPSKNGLIFHFFKLDV